MSLLVKVNLLCKHKESQMQDNLFVTFNILFKKHTMTAGRIRDCGGKYKVICIQIVEYRLSKDIPTFHFCDLGRRSGTLVVGEG